MTPPRDPDSSSVDPTFVPAEPAGQEVTVAPSAEFSAADRSAERTDPSRGTHVSAKSNPTAYDATRPAPPLNSITYPTDGDTDVTRTVASNPVSEGGGPVIPAGVAVERYVLRGFHAKGGLGEVYRAHDLELNREVAFKRIQADNADVLSRRKDFVDEARVTARLDHPSVVPVYGLVTDAYGRPCYAMRFISGATLRDRIDRFYGKARRGDAPVAPEPADPAAREAEFRLSLRRFIAVCQAIGFAHTQGVVHRDLKPANIMVGEFGETLVVDWGLARTIGEASPAESPAADDPTAGTASLPLDPEDKTVGARAVGTPAFMPPEQAVGSPGARPAADIFGLGTILYYTLTGNPPYSAGTGSETLVLASRVEYVRPRAVRPEIPPALEAVCLKAMAPAPGDRYGTALELAADVERWLSDEPVTVYRDPFPARAARWARRNPARVAVTVTALLGGLAAAVAIAVVIQGAKKETDLLNAALRVANDETKAALKKEQVANVAKTAAYAELTVEQEQTEKQRKDAVKAREIAEGRFKLAQSAYGSVLDVAQTELDDRAGTQKAQAAVLEGALKGLEDLVTGPVVKTGDPESLRLEAWARLQMGDVTRALGKTQKSLDQYHFAAAAAEKLEKADQQPAPKASLADARDRLTDTYLALGDVRRAAEEAGEAQRLREGATTPEEKDAKAGTEDRVAAVALEQGKTHVATASIQKVLDIRRERFKTSPTDPGALSGLAGALDRDAEVKLRVGNTAGAAKSAAEAVPYRAAAAAKSDRASLRREWAATLDRLAEVAAERADLAAEVKARVESVAVLEKLVAVDPYNAAALAELAVARGRLGTARLREGDPDGALAITAAARAEADEFKRNDPTSPRSERAVGFTCLARGEVLLKTDQRTAAVREFEAAAAAFESREREEPDSVRARRDAAEARERLALARVAAGDPAAAIGPLTASVETRRKAADADALDARAARDLAVAYGRLSEAHLAAGNYAAAEDAAANATARLRARAEADAVNLAAKRDLAAARGAWGRVTAARGEQTATLILLHQARGGFDEVADADASNAAAAEDKAAALARLADALGDAEFPDLRLEYEHRALAARKAVADAHPKSAVAQVGHVTSLRRVAEVMTTSRRYGDAKKSYEKATAVLEQFPKSPILAAEARAVAEGEEVLAGVRAAAGNRESVKSLPQPVRARVLLVLAEDFMRLNYPNDATWAAKLLGENARGPDDLYRAAVVCARAAARKDAPTEHAALALELLSKAADRGFRNPDLLRARWWDALRPRDAFKAVDARLATPK
jgi:tRNA A-37 threonylcarbamoyl transferase component Bud32